LNNEPGVRSARYAGDNADNEKNIALLLKNLEKIQNRQAQFRTVISLMLDKKEYLFEGICKGTITTAARGTNGFGYDPIFIPEGAYKTFAEMTLLEKNQFSHRKKAVEKLIVFLKSKNEQDKN
jgi:XTP/dITP diphosphohydrolase